MVKVSIIIPVYNEEKNIENTIHNLISQSYKDIEIIFVNDGSTDNSKVIIEQYINKYPHIKLISLLNQGSGAARNAGIQAATGKYIYFPDADDYFRQDLIERLVTSAEQSNADLVLCGFYYINKNNQIKRTKQFQELIIDGSTLRENYSQYWGIQCDHYIQGAPWNKLFLLVNIKNNLIHFPNLRRHQDEIFMLQYAGHAAKIKFISNILYYYNENDMYKQREKFPQNYFDVVQAFKKNCDDIVNSWKEKDPYIKLSIEHNYICKCIVSLELSFGPKFNFNNKNEHRTWITQKISNININKSNFKINDFNYYQRLVILLIRSKNIILLMLLLKIKINIEKHIDNCR